MNLVKTLSIILLSAGVISAAQAAAPGTNLPGAKGMFWEQIEHPEESLNTGIQYWIELKRKGNTTRVSNKFEFRSGDQIRFHVKSNTNGFAYVVLREGSRGEQSVLFPDARHADDNRLKSNVEYTIPGDSFLLFDEFPGTEKVTFIVARNAIEPNRYVPDTFRKKVIVAAHKDGSKDLVPGSFVVGYGSSDNPLVDGSTSPASTEKLPANPEVVEAVNHTSGSSSADQNNAVITVVQKNPADVLAVDIHLEHKP